jgi:hypothetical protein
MMSRGLAYKDIILHAGTGIPNQSSREEFVFFARSTGYGSRRHLFRSCFGRRVQEEIDYL